MSSRRITPWSVLVLLALYACGGESKPVDLVPEARADADVTSGTAPLTVRFAAAAEGGDPPLTVRWDFGDGASAEGLSAEHTFETAGTHDVVVRVTDADGDWDEARIPVEVTVPALVVTALADPAAGRAPLAARFVATVEGGEPPFVYAWSFGDGGQSAAEAPEHTFAAGGNYEVTVTVTDASDQTARGTTEVRVAADLQPTASLSASPTAGLAPLTVAFHGSASGGDLPLGWSWDFGDGAGSAEQNPTHTFQQAGTFHVGLTVTDQDGDHDSAGVSIVVEPNSVPQVSARATPAEGVVPLDVTFEAVVEGGDAPLTFAWAYGDGQTGSGRTSTHRYPAPGTYTAGVTVTDANGDTATAQVTVRPQQDLRPTVALIAEPTRGQAPLDVALTAQVTGGNPPFMYAWTFGDGASASDMQKTAHTYAAPGSYTATVQVTDVDGDVVVGSSVPIVVTPDTVPVAQAVASPSAGRVPLTVNFLPSVQGGEPPLSYAWVFGDGSPVSTEQAPSHLYANPGTYTAHLTVTDSDGDTGTDTVAIEVTPDTEPVVSASGSPTGGFAPLTVAFSAQVTGGETPLVYAWSFGDGTTGSGADVSHVYNSAGAYTARVTVTDADGDVSIDTVGVTVASNAVPAVSVSAVPSHGLVPLQVVFDAQASGGDAPLTFAWSFGDGGTSAEEDPTHLYVTEGTHTATVTVTDANGDAASASVVVSAQASRPNLRVADLQLFPSGDQVLFAIQVANDGTGASPDFRVDVYRDRTTAPVQGELGAYLDVTSLAPGELRWEGGYLTVETGQHAAWAQVDARGLVAESDETDNVFGPVIYDVLGPVRINEVRYQSSGVDAGAFVELVGPAGTDLSDYSVVGVNGADGADYSAVPLTGQTLPADGFFVVGQDATVTEADLVDPLVDLQNGPDSVELRFLSWPVDALAYGVFGTGQVSAGEGVAAPAQPDGQSLGRWPDGSDSDDNASDFFVLDPPTPGAPNALPGDTCGSVVALDGPGTVTGDTATAVHDYGTLSDGTGGACGYTAGQPEVVYAIDLLAGQTLTAEVTAADHDTVLYARSACPAPTAVQDAATQIACDDDGGAGTLSLLSFTASATGTYYVFVDGYGSSSDHFGPFTLQLTVAGP